MAQTINADDGSVSGSAGLKSSSDGTAILALQTKGTTAATIDGSQNVGIGTTSPSYKLHVSSAQGSGAIQSTTTTNSTYLAFTNGGGTSYIGVDNSTGGVFSSGAYGMTLFNAANAATTFFTNNLERMRINSSGNVGVGTNSPGYKLDVDRGATSGFTARFGRSSGTQFYMYSDTSASYLSTDTGLYNAIGFTPASNYINFYTNNAEQMRIDSSGNLMVGATSASGRFTSVTSAASFAGYFSALSGTAGYHGVYSESTNGYGMYGKTSNSSYGGVLGYNYNNTAFGILGYSSYGLYTNTSINVAGTIYTSDARLKENVVSISNGLSVVDQLNPVSFDWKENSARGPSKDYGLIAQEVEQVIPDCVFETQTPARPSEITTPPTLEEELGSYKGVDYSRFIPFLIAAVKELNAKVEAQAAEIAALIAGQQ